MLPCPPPPLEPPLRRTLNGELLLRRTQFDVVHANTVNNDVKDNMEKMQTEMSRFKRERAQFELKATRTQQEKQKV